MIIDMTGRKYGRLLIVSRAKNNKYGDAFWNCICDCGNKVVARGSSIRSGHTKSCGCIQKEFAAKLKSDSPFDKCKGMPFINNVKTIFYAMKQRCYNKNNAEYKYYGGRGIVICKEWLHSPSKFYLWAMRNNFMPGLTIDRINNDKGYSPDNCRFATREEQNRNTSRVHLIIDENSNKFLTARQVAQIIGISRSTAAKWFVKENIHTLGQFKKRFNAISSVNSNRTRLAKGLIGG